MKLRNATRSEQTIAVWGNVPAIYIHADRLSATPFLATFFVEAPLPGFDQHPAYLQNFRRNHPEFVVFVKNGPEGKCDAQNIDLPSAFWRFTALQEILKADYEVVEDAAAYTLFHRRPIASAASHSLRALAN